MTVLVKRVQIAVLTNRHPLGKLERPIVLRKRVVQNKARRATVDRESDLRKHVVLMAIADQCPVVTEVQDQTLGEKVINVVQNKARRATVDRESDLRKRVVLMAIADQCPAVTEVQDQTLGEKVINVVQKWVIRLVGPIKAHHVILVLETAPRKDAALKAIAVLNLAPVVMANMPVEDLNPAVRIQISVGLRLVPLEVRKVVHRLAVGQWGDQ